MAQFFQEQIESEYKLLMPFLTFYKMSVHLLHKVVLNKKGKKIKTCLFVFLLHNACNGTGYWYILFSLSNADENFTTNLVILMWFHISLYVSSLLL